MAVAHESGRNQSKAGSNWARFLATGLADRTSYGSNLENLSDVGRSITRDKGVACRRPGRRQLDKGYAFAVMDALPEKDYRLSDLAP